MIRFHATRKAAGGNVIYFLDAAIVVASCNLLLAM
jgi:hypothetical protein